MKFIRFIASDISPVVYFLVAISQFIGFCFATGILLADTESILYQTGTLFDRQFWGALLLVATSILQLGLILRRYRLVALGGMFGFLLWLSASIDLIIHGHYYIFVSVGLLHTMFHIYVYLASSLDYLERVPKRL